MRRGRHGLRICYRQFRDRRLSRETALEGCWLAILKDPTRFKISLPAVLRTVGRRQHPATGSGILHPESGGERRNEFKQVTKTMPNICMQRTRRLRSASMLDVSRRVADA